MLSFENKHTSSLFLKVFAHQCSELVKLEIILLKLPKVGSFYLTNFELTLSLYYQLFAVIYI